MDTGIVAAIVVYFILMLVLGVYFLKSSKAQGMREYFLGGRKMNPYVTAMSAQASDMSGWLLMGLPGAIVVAGLGQAWIGIGLAIGSYVSWLIVAKRLRKHSVVSGNSITMSEFFSNRYRDDKGLLRIISAIIILFFFTIYVASGFKSSGVVLSLSIDIGLEIAITVGAVITILYTLMGGYTAVCWVDFFQAILMVVCVAVVPLVAIFDMGGFDQVSSALDTAGIPEGFTSLLFDGGEPITFTVLISALAWGLGYFGMPHIIVRFMSLRSEKDLKKSARIGITWNVLIVIFSVAAGCIGHLFLGEIDDSSVVFITMVRKIFPAVISGILLSAILAASMSTADSQLLASASAFASDVYKPIIRKGKAGNKEMTWISRLVVLAIAVVAVIIASNPNSGTIMGLVENAWGVFGAAFGPVIMLSLFWKRLTFGGAVGGILAGAAVDILWLAFLGSTGIYEIIPGFAAGLIAAVVVSLAGKAPGKEVTDIFDRVAAGQE